MKDYLNKRRLVRTISLTSAIITITGTISAQELLTKPAWLPQLSLGVKESYDDNIFGVSGIGMKPQRAWITSISPEIGFDFAPLLGQQTPFQTLLLNYTPDFVLYALPHVEAPYNEPSQNYNAHKFASVIKGSTGDFSFSLDNDFLYNDGSKVAPTYALNQSGAAGEADRYRDHYSYVPAEERASQIEENETAVLEYDLGPVFIRPTEFLHDVNMDTAWHKSSVAPYVGYQNFVDRSDVNGGLDLGYKVLTNVAVTVGYRYGSQFQQQFSPSVSSDYTNYSSSTYQRVLFGLEGKPWDWLQVKLDGGPDFRDYNSHTPISDLHPTKYYAEAALTAAITASQSLSFKYKQWQWVASTGFMPVWLSSYDLDYHWNPTRKLRFDLDAKIQEYDATGGTDVATGTDPSLRSDRLYTLSPGFTYAFTPQLSASLSYTLNAANNELYTLPAALHAAYRNYIDQIVSLGLSYKF
jgi:opacity protein-like surface antigen